MLVSIVLLWFSLRFILLQLKPRRPKNFPPGPLTLPVLGNLLHLASENPLKELKKLRQAYGNVYSLFLGSKPAVVINGLKTMKEAMVLKAKDFAGRPQDLLVNDLTQNKGVIMVDYGSFWKDHRRFSLMTLRNFGLGKKSMEERIHEEIQFTMKTLEKSVGTTLSPQVMFHFAASNIICKVLFGTRYEYDGETIRAIVRGFTELNKIANGPWAMPFALGAVQTSFTRFFSKTGENMDTELCPAMDNFCPPSRGKPLFAGHYVDNPPQFLPPDLCQEGVLITDELYDSVPLVRKLPLPFSKAFKNMEIFLSLSTHFVNEHKKSRTPGEPRDFVDCYLDELDKKEEDSSFSEEQLRRITFDLYLGGTDTISNTLLTGFLYLTNYPHIQERCQQEIDQVLDGRDQVCFEDRHSMPYVQAVTHEVQRVANVLPLSTFHCSTKDTEMMGYTIPKGTLIIQNLDSVLNEEGQWKFPHEFNPENFLTEQGEFVKPEAFMPFSAGPRMCLGEGLARMELFLMTVTLLRRFRFIWPEDAGEPDFTPVYGATLTPKPYRMKVQLRSEQ